jgi:hypothetical protein
MQSFNVLKQVAYIEPLGFEELRRRIRIEKIGLTYPNGTMQTYGDKCAYEE